jgi:hypothetical protein
MRYTIRNIPAEVDRALRKKAKAERTSINQAALDTLRRGLGLDGRGGRRYADLDWFFGSWVPDPEFDRAVAEMDRSHPDDWK